MSAQPHRAHTSIAQTLLHTVGGRTVLLQMSAPAVPGDDTEQLGKALPQFQEVPLGPAVFRKLRAKTGSAAKPEPAQYELLLSALAVQDVVGSLDFNAAEVLFAEACGVVVDGLTLRIASATSVEAFGTVYLYRLVLLGAGKDVR